MTASPLRNSPSLTAAAAPAPGQSALTEQPVTRVRDAAISPMDVHPGLAESPIISAGDAAIPPAHAHPGLPESPIISVRDAAISSMDVHPGLKESPIISAGDAAIPPAHAHPGLPGQTRPAVTGGEYAAPAPGFSASGALTQVGGALLGILLLIIIGGWLLKTLRLTPAGRSGNRLAIRASCSVGPREKVLIMQVDDTWLVLGVTPQHITTLHSLPAPAQSEHDACGPAPEDFRQRLLRLSRQRSGNA